MAKTLKLWNGRGHRNYDKHSFFVAAYTQKQAVEIINQYANCYINTSEIRDYYNAGQWGNSMNHIIPTEPCLYVQKNYGGEEPIKLF